MSEYKNLKNFFKEFDVSPYSLLDLDEESSEKEIKKAYRSKARLIHPDKNTSTDTSLEFQILTMAYQLILIRNQKYIPRKIIINYDDEVEEIDTLPKEDEVSFIRTSAPAKGYKATRSDKTNYSEIQVESPGKLMAKFNTDKFNAIFEHLKDNSESNKSQSLIKHEIIGHTNSKLNMCQVMTDGEFMIVGEEDSLDDYTTTHGIDYIKGFSDIQQPIKKNIPKNIDYSRSYIKENTRKMKNSEIKSSINIISKPLDITYNKSFADSQVDFINNQIENMRQIQDTNKSIIDKKKRIFQLSIDY
jgi:curved DNA-binding protein CbpA